MADRYFRACAKRVGEIAGIACTFTRRVAAVAINTVVAQALCVACADFTQLFLIDAGVATAPVRCFAIRVRRTDRVAEAQAIAEVIPTTTLRIGADTVGCTVPNGPGEVALCADGGACSRTAHAVDAETALALVAIATWNTIELLGLAYGHVAPMCVDAAIVGRTTVSACCAFALVGCTTHGVTVFACPGSVTIVGQLCRCVVTCR